jgi:outer membrane protein TolC
VRRSEYYPKVRAFGGTDALRRDAGFGSDDFSFTIGVGLTYDIFTGGRRRAAVKEAQAALAESAWDLETIELEIASDVRQGVEDLRAAQRDLILQRESTEFVQRNRDLVEKGYREGSESLVRLNEAQTDLIRQQSQLAFARVALRQAWHDLRTATASTLKSQ